MLKINERQSKTIKLPVNKIECFSQKRHYIATAVFTWNLKGLERETCQTNTHAGYFEETFLTFRRLNLYVLILSDTLDITSWVSQQTICSLWLIDISKTLVSFLREF